MSVLRNYVSHLSTWKQLVIILIVAAFNRLLFLNIIPAGISFDELVYFINAKSFFLHGRGMILTPTPIYLTDTFPRAELQSVLFSPILGLFKPSLLLARLPHVLLAVGFCLLLALLAQKLFGKSYILPTGIAIAMNPWHIFMSRTAYDAGFTTFFLFLYLYLALAKNKWIIIVSGIPLLCAFHGYEGMMPVVILFASMTAVYTAIRKETRRYIPYHLITLGILLLAIFRFIFSFTHTPLVNSRAGELFLPTSSVITSQVQADRKMTLVSAATPFYINKISIYTRAFLEKYFDAFSLNRWFFIGDVKTAIYSIVRHGWFYLIDLIFIVIGFIGMTRKHLPIFWLLLAFLVIAPLPSALSTLTVSYTSRSFLLSPIICLFIGFGWVTVWKSRYGKLLTTRISIIAIYLVSIVYFSLIYYLQFPVMNPEGFGFSYRLLSRYLLDEKNSGKTITVITGNPFNAAMQYYFYALKTNTTFQHLYSLGIKKDTFVYAGITFTKCPLAFERIQSTTYILESGYQCPIITETILEKPKVIPRIDDAGSIFFIYQGKTCNQTKLNLFPIGITFKDLNVEALASQDFCQKFIIQYDK